MIKNILFTFFATFLLGIGCARAESSIMCSSVSFTYNDDGSVVASTRRGDTTYASAEEAYLAVYGVVPTMTIEETGYDTLFGLNNSSNNSSSSSNKHRGRLIYTVQEANEVAKDGAVNKVRLRYK